MSLKPAVSFIESSRIILRKLGDHRGGIRLLAMLMVLMLTLALPGFEAQTATVTILKMTTPQMTTQ